MIFYAVEICRVNNPKIIINTKKNRDHVTYHDIDI